jgi:hypothetical protein
MLYPNRRIGGAARAALIAGALLLASKPGSAAELAVFASGATPGPNWNGGFGVSLTITLLNLVGVELEGARQGGAIMGSEMLSASGRAFLAPPFGRFVPYGGFAAGAYKQSLGSQDQWGTVTGAFVGARIKLPLGLLIKGEYEWVHVPTDALIPIDGRFYGGVGISF